MPTSVGLMATLPILQAIRSRFPKIVPRMVESHSGFVCEWLQTGRLDLCMLFGMEKEAWLLQQPLLREELYLIGAHRSGGRALPSSLPMCELADYPLFLSARAHGLRRIIDDACAQYGIRLNVIGDIDSLPNIKKAVESGLGYTVLSPAAVAEEVEQDRLEMATITAPSIVRTVVYATSLIRPLTPAAAAVGALVCERVRALVSEGRWAATLEPG
jgi:LysR family transcriptional regulator, nitrogen assimilation regulatory protein